MIQIHNCEQGSPEWFACRLGLPTASMFATVMARGKDGGTSATRKTYMLKLAGEIITGLPAEGYSNDHMARGQAMEEEARERYAFEHDADPEIVGFISNGQMGASPDSLIGKSGALEIKTKQPNILIEAMLRDDAPPEHKAQCQGVLLVAEREWIDLACYWPAMPLVRHRLTRDEPYLANMKGEIDRFNDELAAVVEKVRRYGQPQRAAA
jgi:hypothetical protein